MSEQEASYSEPHFDATDEPVFSEEQPPVDEPFFAPADQVSMDRSVAPPPEPVFVAVPAKTHGVSLPIDASHSGVGWEASTSTAEAENSIGQQVRRLGQHPLGVAVTVLAVVALVALWFSQGRSVETVGEPDLLATTVPGVVGSVVLGDAGAEQAQESATPAPAQPQEAVPDTRLGAGQQVAVANTNGQGIRLRSAPGTDALTLGIYNDGAPFLVLSPGGDYGDYPVEVDGYFWYRIRVVEDPADQLVGWAAGDFLVSRDP